MRYPSVIVRQGTVLCLAPDEVSLRGESSPDARKGSAACAQEQGSVEAAEILQETKKGQQACIIKLLFI